MSFHRYLSGLHHSLQGNRSARRAKKRRQSPRLTFYRPCLECLEDRTLLSSNPFQTLGQDMGSLTNVQNTLTNTLNNASHIPLLSQQSSNQSSNSSGVLGNFPDAQKIVTQTLVQNIGNYLKGVPDSATDGDVQNGLASALGLQPNQVHVSHPGSSTNVEIELDLQNTITNATLPANFKLNLGLPGLPVNIGASTQGSIHANLSYQYALGFGYNGSFFVDGNTKVSDFGSGPAHQFEMQATVQPSADFKATATVGLLQATISNKTDNSNQSLTKINATFDMDGISLSGTPTVALSGNATIDLQTAANFGTSNNFSFPGIGAELYINWNLSNSSPSDVAFKNVSFTLGSFLSQFVAPIVQDIQTYTAPLTPIIDLLTAPIPGLSDLSHLIGAGDITLLGIAKEAAALNLLPPGIDQAVQIAALLIQVNKDIDDLEANDSNVTVPLGDFSLNTNGDTSSLLNGTVDFGNLEKFGVDLASNLLSGIQGSNVVTSIDDAAQKIGLGPVASKELEQLGQVLGSANNGLSFDFPIIDDPAKVIFPMLLGHDSDLASLDFNLNLNADASGLPTNLSVLGMGVGVNGSVAAQVHLHLAYDTYGIREFFSDLANGNSKPGDLVDGFYIKDATPNTPQFSIGGSLQAYAQASIAVFSAGVSGGIWTGDDPNNATNNPIIVNLHDANSASDDGKLRISKIDSSDLFDASGKLEAGINAFIKVGFDSPFGFVGYEHTFNIAEVTLIDFGTGTKIPQGGLPSKDPPIIAGDPSTGNPTVDANGVLTLFMGINAQYRKNVPGDNAQDAAGPEQWDVSHDANDPADTVTVTAFGVTEKVSGVKKIVAYGGQGADTITIESGVLADAELHGGQGANKLTYQGSGHAKLYGGPGDDQISVGTAAQSSELHGGGGNDTLIAAGGDDTLYGEGSSSDRDNFYAGAGNDTLYGGQGNNQFTAGTGSATITGYGGQDDVSWKVGDGNLIIDSGADSAGSPPDILELLGSSNPDVFVVGADAQGNLQIQAPGATIQAKNIEELHIDSDAGNDSITVNDLTGTTVRTVALNVSEAGKPDGAQDTVSLSGATAAGTLSIGEINVTSQSLPNQPPVSGNVMDVKGFAAEVYVANDEDSLNVNLLNADNTVSIKTPTLKGAVTVNGGTGINTYNVQAIAGPTTINGKDGQNTYNVGSNAPNSGGTLSAIQGSLTLNGSGGSDTANVDDTGDTSSQSGTLTPTALTGLGMGPNGIAYSGLAALNISLGSGGNAFTINVPSGTNLPAATTVDGGTGSNDSLTATFAQDMNGTLLLTDFEQSTIKVGGNLNGYLSDTSPGSVQLLSIGGSLTATGKVVAGSIDTLTIAQDLAGSVLVLGNLGSASIGNNLSGSLTVDGNATTVGVGADVSGLVHVVGSLTTLTIGGSLTSTGQVTVGQNLNTMSVGVNLAGQVLVGQALSYLTVGQDLSGLVSETGTMQQVTIGGSLTYTGIVNASNNSNPAAANIVFMTIGPNSFSPGHDMAGQIIVSGTLTQLIVAGGTPGTIVAGQVGQVLVYGGYGPLVSQIKENGIQRRVEAALPSDPYPLPNPPGQQPPPNDLPDVLFQYIYEGTSNGLANPQLTVRVANNASTALDQYDLSLVVYSDTAKFNLARLDAAGVSGIRNVAVEGDLLTSVSQAAINFMGGDTTPAGVRLAGDHLAGVAVRDYAPLGFIQAASIQAAAFGSTTNGQGNLVTGPNAMATDAEDLLTPDTLIVQASDTFRAPFADVLPVAFFMDTQVSDHHFDSHGVLFTDQAANDARGAVTALVNVTVPVNPPNASTIQTIALRGDGGAIQTQQPIVQSITSTGPLGDLILTAAGGLPANVTAPSIIGNIEVQGPISGIIQTTGLRTDPITGVISTVSADWGTSTTVVQAQGGGITGELVSRGNFLSQIESNGGISGVVAVQGNLGGQIGGVRYGGINLSNGSISGQVVVLGNVLGDIVAPGGLKGGRIAVQGSILGNTVLTGGIDASSALVAGGDIGDATAGTGLTAGTVLGILAANGSINLVGANDTSKASFFKSYAKADFFKANLSIVDPASAATIDSIFTSGFGLDLSGLALMLQNLEDLSVSSSGGLVLI